MKQIYLFTTPTCAPCKVMKPILEELVAGRSDMQYETVECWDRMDLVRQYNVRMSPTLIILKDGQLIADIRGLLNRDDLIEALEKEER